MKSDQARLLSVSLAAMGLPNDLAPGERIVGESAGVPPDLAEEGISPPWSGYARWSVYMVLKRSLASLLGVFSATPASYTPPILRSLGARMCIRVPTNDILVPVHCMFASVLACAGWGRIPEY